MSASECVRVRACAGIELTEVSEAGTVFSRDEEIQYIRHYVSLSVGYELSFFGLFGYQESRVYDLISPAIHLEIDGIRSQVWKHK